MQMLWKVLQENSQTESPITRNGVQVRVTAGNNRNAPYISLDPVSRPAARQAFGLSAPWEREAGRLPGARGEWAVPHETHQRIAGRRGHRVLPPHLDHRRRQRALRKHSWRSHPAAGSMSYEPRGGPGVQPSQRTNLVRCQVSI